MRSAAIESGGRYKHGNLQATPIVEDGMMYVTDGWGSVYAIDVAGGKKGVIKWKFDPGTDRAWAGDVACCGVNNRGVALWKDKIISISLDGRLFSLNKATGEMVWERKVADPAIAETLTLAPLVVRDLAIVGSAGGEFGIRGWIDATDLNTGKQAWRTYTIPGAGEPGNETWKDGKERWKHGGGSVWETATYDPESDTFYQGIGNAGPDWDPEYRPGDNKWAASVLALSPSDGKIKWGYPVHPERSLRLRRDLRASDHQRQGQRRGSQARGACRAQRLLLCARPHQRLVRHRQAVRRQLNWTPGLDPKTGRPLNYNPNTDVQEYAPGSHGSRADAHQRATVPVALRRQELGALRLQSRAQSALHSLDRGLQHRRDRRAEGLCRPGWPDQAARAVRGRRQEGQPSVSTAASRRSIRLPARPRQRLKLEYPNYSGALATAGNLVFLGHYDGTFTAHDAKTLQELWSFNIGTGINAPAVTYSVNGKQYVAVLVGSRQALNVWQNAARAEEHGNGIHAVCVRTAVTARHRQVRRREFAPAFPSHEDRKPDLRGCGSDRCCSQPEACPPARKPRSRPRTRARSNSARKSTRSRRTASSATSGTPRAIPAMAASHFRCARPRSRPSSSPKW